MLLGRRATLSSFGTGIRLPLLTLIVVLALSLPAVGEAQLVLYDDFKSRLIDPEKWSGFSTNAPVGPTTEVVRQINSGQLELRINQYGSDDVSGGTSYGNSGVNFHDPATIITIQAGVRMSLATAEACPTGGDASVRGGLHARFFNDGASSGPGDSTGDVQAVFSKTHATNLGNVVRAELFRCSDAPCSSAAIVDSQTFPGTWRINESNVMTLTWDAANNQILYSIQRGKSTDTIALSYTLDDIDPPGVNFKNIIVEAIAADCGGDRKHAFGGVLIDDVMVNP